MKSGLIRILILAVIQAAAFFLPYHFLRFDFSLAYVFSFIFTLFFAALILEGRTIKNAAAYVLALLNILFIVGSFFIFSKSLSPEKAVILPESYSKIKSFEETLQPPYSSKDMEKIKKSFYYIAFQAYYPALKQIQEIEKETYFIHKLRTYILSQKDRMESQINLAKKEIPDFPYHLKLYQRGDLTGFMESLHPYRKNPQGNFFYSLAKQTLLLKSNPKLLEKNYYQSIDQFMKTLENSTESFFHLVYIFPELKETYSIPLNEKQNSAFSFLDFQGISLSSSSLKNYFTLIRDPQGKNYMIHAEELILPPNQYPLIAVKLKMISEEGEELLIPMAKINAHYLVYQFQDKGTSQWRVFPDLYSKFKNSLEMMKKPMNPLWISSYQKDYPEIFHYVVKPFWLRFLKLLAALGLAFLLTIFTIFYIKTLTPGKVPFYFYILPLIFNILLSLLYSNFILKALNRLF